MISLPTRAAIVAARFLVGGAAALVAGDMFLKEWNRRQTGYRPNPPKDNGGEPIFAAASTDGTAPEPAAAKEAPAGETAPEPAASTVVSEVSAAPKAAVKPKATPKPKAKAPAPEAEKPPEPAAAAEKPAKSSGPVMTRGTHGADVRILRAAPAEPAAAPTIVVPEIKVGPEGDEAAASQDRAVADA